MEFLSRLFGRESSKDVAKERLRLVLVHDRASVSPQILDSIRGEILQVISRYLEIDEEQVEVGLTRTDRMVALTASIPVRRVKRALEA